MEQQISDNQFKGKGAFDAFLNLLCLITLGWMSISIGAILFQLISKFATASINAAYYGGSFSQGALKFNIASAIIITPIFLGVAGWLHRNYKTDNLNFRSGIHRWLTYLMLLASALTVIGRLVYQLFRFLDGDFALAVILRTLVILVIAGGIFSYYFYDLVRKEYAKRSPASITAFVAVIVIGLASVVGSFFIIDSPAKTRVLQFDARRTNDLANISYSINSYYQQNNSLPADLSAAQFASYKDPETNQPYEYRAIAAGQYELCAVFSLPAPSAPNDMYAYPASDMADVQTHGAGRQCFIRNAVSFNEIKRIIN